LSASGVVFGVGRKDQQHVERHANRISLNLDVAFLHYVEQAYLNFAREVGEFVDRKHSSISSRQQPVMNRQLVRKNVPPAGGLYRIQVADKIGNCDVRSRKLLHISDSARDEDDRSVIPQ